MPMYTGFAVIETLTLTLTQALTQSLTFANFILTRWVSVRVSDWVSVCFS